PHDLVAGDHAPEKAALETTDARRVADHRDQRVQRIRHVECALVDGCGPHPEPRGMRGVEVDRVRVGHDEREQLHVRQLHDDGERREFLTRDEAVHAALRRGNTKVCSEMAATWSSGSTNSRRNVMRSMRPARRPSRRTRSTMAPRTRYSTSACRGWCCSMTVSPKTVPSSAPAPTSAVSSSIVIPMPRNAPNRIHTGCSVGIAMVGECMASCESQRSYSGTLKVPPGKG